MAEINIFPYRYLRTKQFPESEALFGEIKDYELDVPCIDTGVELKYIFRSYRFNTYLYITDIFPAMWENDNDCFKRILSHEGNRVNMRRLSVTCLLAFKEHYIRQDIDSAMVISGSYEYGENETAVSRKLRLYWAFFAPLLDLLSLRVVQISSLNAFVLIDKNSAKKDRDIVEEYITFKKRQNIKQ
ncbi:MAG: hypothetical protein ACK5KT_11675 [Dysgonomonas sp.]